ncbi:hypothetical protein BDN72DRAFT_844479 [Pluteus cervinus]|uniref:Uncharacterized protein n=1 Tax=Pluteus cervinus TaxID=181527 RepID=A0ACD3ALG2_9AGAR|nr:hypothetical protein BDN72DRAFT_844479 [Pluteus cervinus]
MATHVLRISFNDAANFLAAVKKRCTPEVYDEFLDLMVSYVPGGQQRSEAIEQVVHFFDTPEHIDLIGHFSTLVPDRELEYGETIDPRTRVKVVHISTQDTRIVRRILSTGV